MPSVTLHFVPAEEVLATHVLADAAVHPMIGRAREVAAFIRRFPGLLDEVRDDPVEALPDLNLDTGQPESQVWGHRAAGRTLAELKRRREASGVLAAS